MTAENESPRRSGEEEDLHWIKNSIGPMSSDQERIVRAALRENAPGVLACCSAIANDPNVRSPIAVLMHNLAEGKHRAAPAQKRRRARPAGTTLERAHALFAAKYRELQRADPPDWNERERRLYAVDYALDWCGANGGELISIEDDLRSSLDAERRDQDRDHERDTPHRRLMIETHGPRRA